MSHPAASGASDQTEGTQEMTTTKTIAFATISALALAGSRKAMPETQ